MRAMCLRLEAAAIGSRFSSTGAGREITAEIVGGNFRATKSSSRRLQETVTPGAGAAVAS